MKLIQKMSSKEGERNAIKLRKRNQLALILINKFRNKYGINTLKERAIDARMQDEVNSMLA